MIMNAKIILLAIVGITATAHYAVADLPHIKAELTYAPNVPPPITRHEPAIVEVDLTAGHKVMTLSSPDKYQFWTFNDHTPGPFIRVRVGDWLEVHLSNKDTGGMPHNVDFHAVMGPGGGAQALAVLPGATVTAWFRLQHPGLFVYHCSIPPMIDHVANGMFGMILVEPANGLPHVDKEFYVMQSEFYTKKDPANSEMLAYSHELAVDGRPTFVLFNGEFGSMLDDNALHVKSGESVRIYFGNIGPNLISTFHIIGMVMQNVYLAGSLANPPMHGLQTVMVPPGSAAIIETTPEVPGDYKFIDHSMTHFQKGAAGEIDVSGSAQPEVYRTQQDGPPTQ